jgi:V/A-type H+-transporting ATPase subunit D
MELTRLKNRLKVAARGHKLLKDKRDEMVRRFMQLIRENKSLREQVEKELGVALTSFTMASLSMSEEEMNAALLAPARKGEIEVSLENIMSVNVPKIEFEEHEVVNSFYPYGMLGTVGELDVAVDKLASVLPSLVKLAQLEKTCNMLADEIEKTRRRVNALEYVMIPQMEETIKYITMKLDENERGNLTRLMKTKEMMN